MGTKNCDHEIWLYEHTVYSGDREKSHVHRQCAICGFHQCGDVTRWRPMEIGPGKEFNDVPDLCDDLAALREDA